MIIDEKNAVCKEGSMEFLAKMKVQNTSGNAVTRTIEISNSLYTEDCVSDIIELSTGTPSSAPARIQPPSSFLLLAVLSISTLLLFLPFYV